MSTEQGLLTQRGLSGVRISVGGPKGEKSRKEREDQSSNSFALTHMRVHTHTHTHRVDSRGEKSGYILIARAF